MNARAAGPPETLVSLMWLVRVRWAALLALVLFALLAERALHLQLPGGLVVLAALVALSNGAAHAWAHKPRSDASRAPLFALLGVDAALLTAALYLTGGATNPFVGAYLVLVVLAAALLGRRAAVMMVVASVACVGLLTAVHVPLRPDHDHGHRDDAGGLAHHHGPMSEPEHLGQHVQGTSVALAVLALLIGYLVSWALEQREQQLAALRAERARADKLVELGALAATAAHELGSPLTTIAVIAKELEHRLCDEELAGDARAIRVEVDRCRQVLDDLRKTAQEQRGEAPRPVSLAQVLEDARALMATPERVEVALAEASSVRVMAPPRATRQVLRSLLANACEAHDDAPVRVTARADAERCRIEIRDEGVGMSAEELERASHAPFTSKPGRGMGVGLFLGRAVVERIGGTLELHSHKGRGTRVVLSLPLAPPAEEV